MRDNPAMRSCFVALCLTFVSSLALAQESVRMRILVNGTAVGENVYTRGADGAFSSKSNLDLGSIKVGSTASGHFKGDRLADASAENTSPAGNAKIVYAKGRVDATVGGKTNGGAWQDKTGNFGGNLHPQFFATSLSAAEKAIQASQAAKTATIQAYFIDAGAVLPLKVSMQQPVSLEVGGAKVTARHFGIEVATIKIDFFMDQSGRVVAEDIPSQHIRFLVDGWEAAFVDPMTKFPELSQATYKTKTEKGVHCPMRDRVDLICDVVRPDDNEKHPTILVRTPYGRGSETPGGMFYASRGYVYVTQDCRGREDSYGDWDPFVHEGPDGYDTIQWIASQPWSNGNVGMIGGSYSGYVQWAAAVLNPPALKCIVPQVSPPDAMRNIPYDMGVFFLYGDIWWAQIVAGRRSDFSDFKGSLPHPEKFDTLPLSKVDEAVLGRHLDFFDKWLSRPTIGDWNGMDFTFHLADAHVPALHISGIWDGDEIGTHLNWNTMRELKRDNQWIVFGPWVHAFNTNHSFADVEYGPDAIIDLDSVTLRWFDTWLKGKDVGQNKVPHAKLFVTGANKWVDLADWPDSSMHAKTLYFAKDGLADTAGPEGSRQYTYDPAKDHLAKEYLDPAASNPTTVISEKTTRGGFLLESAPLMKDTAIAAPFNVKLCFTTSALDTDFFVDIADVAPNGQARLLGQPGKVRASYLGGLDAVRPLTPGKEYTVNITPWDFAHEFKKGHRIGLVVTSSMFPSYARNLGTAEPIKNATRMVTQKNTILMGRDHPSSLTFQVLWEK